MMEGDGDVRRRATEAQDGERHRYRMDGDRDVGYRTMEV
jgi:hypothetical protein